MLTSGQKIFALVFIVCFIIGIGYQFYLDRKRNKKQFKGTIWILVALIAIMVSYVLMSRFLH